ncbi:hypothetical protein IAD21_02427 [Abditibacteriota bacterium]|nr:hypothetical protein IAD21_02427 [Abditibacteriota bacterium]
MEKSIPNRACGDKRRHALTLPENGALHARKIVLAHKWLDDFDRYAQNAYDKAREDAHTLRRILQHAAPDALQTARELDVMPTFPFAARGICFASLDEMNARTDVCALELNEALSSGTLNTLFPLLRFLAAHILHAQHAGFADEVKEAAWFARGDERARNDTPMHYRLFEMYLEHSGRADELKADGLLISDILPDCNPVERTPAHFAEIFEEDLVRLYDEKKDRLAVVIRTMSHHKRPSITEEEVESDHTLGLVLRHWEREHAPILTALQAEKAQLEAWLATDGVEKAYWWAREVDRGLDDCDVARPALGLALDHWRSGGIAGDEITVDAIFEELFKES